MKRFLLASIAIILAINLNAQQTGTFKDSRDGKTYKIVRIGNQVWMAENLAFKPDSGNYWAYNDNSDNVAKYGYLYDWHTARNVCPTGWHLPSDAEWRQLTDFLGSNPGTKLKAKSGWSSNGNGTDYLRFSALPGGSRHGDGYVLPEFRNLGSYGSWWSSTERSGREGFYRFVGSDLSSVERPFGSKSWGYSVRCLRD